MGLFVPLALLALPLIGIVVALYLLKLRRPTAPVGSLHLWQSLTRDREANSLWQRLRISGLLILQVIILLVLILALARPWVPSDQVLGQNAVLVMDVSASMGSQDRSGGPTRLKQAQDKAKSIVDSLPQGATAILIASTDRATILVPSTGDMGRIKSAIDTLKAQAAPSDMTAALKLAAAFSSSEANSVTYIVSDGAFPPASGVVDTIRGTISFVGVGEAYVPEEENVDGNQGITALTLQKDNGGLSLFLQVSNAQPVSATRRIDLLADDEPWTARNVEIGPGATQELIVEDVPLSARVVQARFAGVDSLAVDDKAWVVNRASVPGNVLLVTDENKFLELALSLLPTVALYKVQPKDYTPDSTINGAPFDLTIFDAGVPTTTLQTLPPGSVMMFAPVATNELITVTGVLSNPTFSTTSSTTTQPGTIDDGREPLLRFVDLANVHISQAAQLEPVSWGRSIAASGLDPLIVAGEKSGRKAVVFAFDLHSSDLPLQTAFPLLMRNLITYLLPLPAGGLPAEVVPDQPVGISLVSKDITRVVVEDPGARENDIPVAAGSDRVAYGDTSLPGVYYVTQYTGDTIVAQEAFAVNLFSRSESLTGPNPKPELPAATAPALDPNSAEASEARDNQFRRELWPVVALIGLIVLLIEWLFAQRLAIRRALVEWQTRRSAQRLERM